MAQDDEILQRMMASNWVAPPPAIPEAAIVAGDLNFTPDHVEYPKIIEAGLVDACSRMDGETFPAEGRIDHVFVTPDLEL